MPIWYECRACRLKVRLSKSNITRIWREIQIHSLLLDNITENIQLRVLTHVSSNLATDPDSREIKFSVLQGFRPEVLCQISLLKSVGSEIFIPCQSPVSTRRQVHVCLPIPLPMAHHRGVFGYQIQFIECKHDHWNRNALFKNHRAYVVYKLCWCESSASNWIAFVGVGSGLFY